MQLIAQNHSSRLALQRGVGLIDSLVAIIVLSFGILGLVHFQANMLGQNTLNQARMEASRLADELAVYVRADSDNAGCYSIPAQGACASPDAAAFAQSWLEKARTKLPGGGPTATASFNDSTKQLTIRLTWKHPAGTVNHSHEVKVDVNP